MFAGGRQEHSVWIFIRNGGTQQFPHSHESNIERMLQKGYFLSKYKTQSIAPVIRKSNIATDEIVNYRPEKWR